jgi:DNA primase catalytic core
MAHIPESEIERLKLQVSVVRLVEAAGVQLKTHGKNLVGRCPFHDDKTPSLVVSPKSNLWHCMGACQAGGSAIDWTMRWEGVSFRRAAEMLREQIGAAPDVATAAPKPTADPSLAADVDDRAMLRRVIGFYHATLKQSPEALAYLAKRGLTHPEVVDHFQLGFANRTLGYRLANKRTVAREQIKAQLERIGIYRKSGHEHLNGSLVVPVINLAGEITEAYGRKVTTKLRAGTPLHVYLPGPHRGVFNEQGLVGQEEIILCEALIDALTFWCAGFRNVTASYGIEGFTDDHLAAFKRHGNKRVLIAYDADAAGNAAAEKIAKRLMAEGLECFRCVFPKGMDANEYALSVTPAGKALGLAIRRAEWLGKGAAPAREPTLLHEPPSAPAPEAPQPAAELPVLVANPEVQPTPAAAPVSAAPADTPVPLPQPPAPIAPLPPPVQRVPVAAPELPVKIAANGELSLALGDRLYRVRGIEKNLSYDQLKVLVRIACGTFEHIDTLECYQAKARAAWVKAASIELGVSEDILRADFGKLLQAIEQRQDQIIRRELKPAQDATTAAAEIDPALREDALALLRDPRLLDRIVADIEACGVVGEAANALVSYLACVSRKLDKPLAVLVQSTSAAGKSTLMDAVLALMPESERVHYSAMTGQSLFYLGEGDLQHKILAIAEEEGVRQAAYALKLLQSQGELTIASTGKDPTTGKLVTEEYRVRGPVMLFLTTTAIDVDDELQNRCMVLAIDESREQTRLIHQRQRAARTLAGVMAIKTADAVRARHQIAQQLLRPLVVVNPFAEQLTFRDESTRLRRDHQKYLTLIEAIALLHQYQRPLLRTPSNGSGGGIEYIEVTPADIALANSLASQVLGRSLDELPPQTRRLLSLIHGHVIERAKAQAIEPSLVRFTRRELRESIGWGYTQLTVHLMRLEQLEYLLLHHGRAGQRVLYELVYQGEAIDGARFLPGLLDPGALAYDTHLSGVTLNLSASAPNLSGRYRPAVGPVLGVCRVEPMMLQPNAGAACSESVGDLFEDAVPRRINGESPYAHADGSSL